jgi:hypothetical protein
VTAPTFGVDGCGGHFWWAHDCIAVSRRVFTHLSLGDKHGWRLANAEPLTLRPGVRCLDCPTAGFIRDGQWVSA